VAKQTVAGLEEIVQVQQQDIFELQERLRALEILLEERHTVPEAPTNIPPGTTWCPSCGQAKLWGRLGCPNSVCLQRQLKSRVVRTLERGQVA
jgi:hypothetical protein